MKRSNISNKEGTFRYNHTTWLINDTRKKIIVTNTQIKSIDGYIKHTIKDIAHDTYKVLKQKYKVFDVSKKNENLHERIRLLNEQYDSNEVIIQSIKNESKDIENKYRRLCCLKDKMSVSLGFNTIKEDIVMKSSCYLLFIMEDITLNIMSHLFISPVYHHELINCVQNKKSYESIKSICYLISTCKYMYEIIGKKYFEEQLGVIKVVRLDDIKCDNHHNKKCYGCEEKQCDKCVGISSYECIRCSSYVCDGCVLNDCTNDIVYQHCEKDECMYILCAKCMQGEDEEEMVFAYFNSFGHCRKCWNFDTTSTDEDSFSFSDTV